MGERNGLIIFTTCSVKFSRIIMPDKIINGSNVGTIRLNQSCKPVSEKERLSIGNAKSRAVMIRNRKVRKEVLLFFLKISPDFML